MKICSIYGCENNHLARGFCSRHYAAFKRHGDPLCCKMTERGLPMMWLLEHQFHQENECLQWPFAKSRDGYGQIYLREKGHATSAHRVMCQLAHGDPPVGDYEAAHSCGQGKNGCINPRHLRWATPKENSADTLTHGTRNRGERNGNAKLKISDVVEIREMYRTGTLQADLSQRYKLCSSSISNLVNYKTWVGVP